MSISKKVTLCTQCGSVLGRSELLAGESVCGRCRAKAAAERVTRAMEGLQASTDELKRK